MANATRISTGERPDFYPMLKGLAKLNANMAYNTGALVERRRIYRWLGAHGYGDLATDILLARHNGDQPDNAGMATYEPDDSLLIDDGHFERAPEDYIREEEESRGE